MEPKFDIKKGIKYNIKVIINSIIDITKSKG